MTPPRNYPPAPKKALRATEVVGQKRQARHDNDHLGIPFARRGQPGRVQFGTQKVRISAKELGPPPLSAPGERDTEGSIVTTGLPFWSTEVRRPDRFFGCSRGDQSSR